jgi:hypothetical protein
MVNIIVPSVMSFPTDGNDSNCVVDGWRDEDEGNGAIQKLILCL